MARYDAEHKAGTRRRIIDTAGRRFKQDGIDGSGVAALMSDAGLTNGAFYAHFESKDDLVANVVADQLATSVPSSPRYPRAGRHWRNSCAATSRHLIGTIRARAAPPLRCSMRSDAAMTPSAIPTPRECNPSST